MGFKNRDNSIYVLINGKAVLATELQQPNSSTGEENASSPETATSPVDEHPVEFQINDNTSSLLPNALVWLEDSLSDKKPSEDRETIIEIPPAVVVKRKGGRPPKNKNATMLPVGEPISITEVISSTKQKGSKKAKEP